MKTIELTKGKIALVDDEDFERVSKLKWYPVCGARYASTVLYRYLGKYKYQHINIRLHRFIMGLTQRDIMDVDHINHNGLDNRKTNLRICSRSQNSANSRLSKDSTSGFKGVYWHAPRRKWRARICKDGKRINLGTFADKKDAALAYNNKAMELFGEFACLNKIGE